MAVRTVTKIPLERQERLGRLLMRVSRELRLTVDRQLAPFDLTLQQAELLVWTSLQQGLSASDLTELLLTDDAGVSRLVDRLEAKGLMRRGKGRDRRSRALELTSAGRALAKQLRGYSHVGNDHLFSGFTTAERAQLRALLLRVLEAARRMPRLTR